VLVSYEKSAGVATISMDDGKVNVMSCVMLRELTSAFERAENDGAIVLLIGARRSLLGRFRYQDSGEKEPARSFRHGQIGR
jgi:enoyl-CoA hydratase